MATVFAFIVGLALAMLIFAIVDKIVGLFLRGWIGIVVSFVIGAAVVWFAADHYLPVLLAAFGA